MKNPTFRGWARYVVPAGFALSVASPAHAGTGVTELAWPDPADAGVSVTAPPYQSSFEGYQPFGEEDTTSWKENNELTGRVGGWRAYAKEARTPSPSLERTSPSDAAADHAGHQGGAK